MDIKEKIIKVSYDLFLKYGLRRVSIDDICSEVRISKKTFYTHFKQKEELVSTIIEVMHKEQQAIKRNYPDEFTAIDQFMEDYKFHQKPKHEKHLDLLFDLQKYYPEIHRQHLDKVKLQFIEDTTDFIERGISEGLFRDSLNSKAMAVLMRVKFSEAFIEVRTMTGLRMSETFDVLFDAMIHMLANEKGLEYYNKLRIQNIQ